MARQLILEEVGEQGVTPLATLGEGETVIGREPDMGIALGFTSISREHGKILRIRNHWFYCDIGSTNGSWINGVPATAGQWCLLRSGDYLQLADKALRVREAEEHGSAALEVGVQRSLGKSLVIFTNGNFADEFPVPEFGKALVVGGAHGDLEIRGDLFEKPALVVERRATGVCAYAVEQQHGTRLNGLDLTQTQQLKDRDVLLVKEHVIILSDPPILAAGGVGTGLLGGLDGGSSESRFKSWGADSSTPDLIPPVNQGGYPEQVSDSGVFEKRPTLVSQFGRTTDDNEPAYDETMAVDGKAFRDSFRSADHHPGTRYTYDDTGEYSFSSKEDRITIIVGIFLLVLLLILIVWWVFLV